MKAERPLIRELIRTLAVVLAALAAAGGAVWGVTAWIRGPHLSPDPGVTVSDMDSMIEKHADMIDRGMELLWRHHELFEDFMLIRGDASSGYMGGPGWPLGSVNHRLYMSDGEWQTVMEMMALLEPYCIIYQPAWGALESGCDAWSVTFHFSVADDVRPWREGSVDMTYTYIRCAGEGHEDADPAACEALRACWSDTFRRCDSYEPMGSAYGYRGVRWNGRGDGP